MRFEYAPPETLMPAEWRGLFESGQVGGWSAEEVMDAIMSSCWRVFRLPGGLVAISVKDAVMTIEALSGKGIGWSLRGLEKALQALARHYKCYKAETMCFDERLAAAMMRIGARPTAWQLTWQVKEEGSNDGQ